MKTSTSQQIENIGRDVLRIVEKEPNATAIGQLIDDLLDAAVTAALPGRQTNVQVEAFKLSARKAFARKLARRAKKLA